MTTTSIIHAGDANDAARSAGEITGSEFIAGGTTIVDLLQLGIISPNSLVNLSAIPESAQININDDWIYLAAGTKMSAVGRHPEIARRLPVVADAINKAASPQIRNMATVAGNLLQRTRCPRFRDLGSACNRREPQSGCERSPNEIRHLAIFGASSACQSNYPGDLAVALTALDATVDIISPTGFMRTRCVEDLFRVPKNEPHLAYTLSAGELITGINIPNSDWSGSVYQKVRDRASYAFALVSAAVALREKNDGTVLDARIALGGAVAKPWRCRAAEQRLVGLKIDEGIARSTADLCLVEASTGGAADKLRALFSGCITRALLRASTINDQ